MNIKYQYKKRAEYNKSYIENQPELQVKNNCEHEFGARCHLAFFWV